MKKTNTKELISMIVAFVVIGVLALYIVLQLVAPDLTVKVFGFKPYVVITESMEPVLNVNDMVIVKRFDVEELEAGDIITFRADIDYDGDKEIVTHYIYSIGEDDDGYRIRTRRYYEEESQYAPDNWTLSEDDVLGLYSFHIPWVGSIAQFVKSPFGIAAIIVNVGVIVGIVYIIKYGKKEPEKVEEPNE